MLAPQRTGPVRGRGFCPGFHRLCSRPISGVGLGLLLWVFSTAVSRPLLYTVFRSAIYDCL